MNDVKTSHKRITVALTPRAYAALKELQGIFETDQTEVLNRLLPRDAELARVEHAGGTVHVREPGAEPERLRCF